MIRYSELQIGDWVLVSGTPRKVEMITKKKIGYQRKENEPRLYYARLCEVEPIEIKSMRFKSPYDGFIINDLIHLDYDIRRLTVETSSLDNTLCFRSSDGEVLFLKKNTVHCLQHLLRIICTFVN